MQRQVVITGIGVLSTLGTSPRALHTALCAGQSSLGPIGRFDTAHLTCAKAHELTDFDAKAFLGKKNLRALERKPIRSRLIADATGSHWEKAPPW